VIENVANMKQPHLIDNWGYFNCSEVSLHTRYFILICKLCMHPR